MDGPSSFAEDTLQLAISPNGSNIFYEISSLPLIFITYLEVLVLEVISRKVLDEEVVESLRAPADACGAGDATFVCCLENANMESERSIHFFAVHLQNELKDFL